MKDKTKTKGQLVEEVSTLRSELSDLKRRETERKQAEEAAQQARSLLTSILESTADGILVIDTNGKVIIFNKKFLSLWRIPESLAAERDDDKLLNYVLSQLKDPAGFIEQVKKLYSQPEAESFDVLEFKDGRVFERFSQPQRLGNDIAGRVWSFRDVTDRRRAEEEQRRDRESAERLAEEIAVIAEIGRLIGSTLDIDEVYERFAEEVRKIIPFDRIVIATINVEMNRMTNDYITGGAIADRKAGESYPLEGSITFEAVRTKSSLLIQPEDVNEYKDRFPALLSTFQAGFRSIMTVPLFSKGEAMGALLLRSFKTHAYTDKDVRLAERVGNQIAGAIANAKLFAEFKKAEESLRESEREFRLFVENAPDAVFVHTCGCFAYLNPSAIRLFGVESAEDLLGRPVMERIPPDYQGIAKERMRLLNEERIAVHMMNQKYLKIDGLVIDVEVSAVPITYEDSNGGLVFVRDITQRKQAEEEQRRDRESAERLAKEMGVIAEIGRLISSTLDIHNVYERFAAETKKLIPFDRIAVNVKHPHEDASVVAYVSGIDIPSRKQGTSTSEAGSLNGAVLSARTGLVIQPEGTPEGIAEIVSRFPLLSPSFQAGLLSFLSVPLIYRDEAVGVLHFRSKKTKVYTEQDLRLAERIGDQIAGAIANSQLFADLKKMEEEQRRNRENAERLAEEVAIIAEIGRLIGSTLDIEDVYERVAAEARKLIPFDRIAVNLFNIHENTLTIAYVSGADISHRKQGDSPSLAGTLTEEVIRGRTGLIIQPESIDEIVNRIPGLSPTFQAGLRSLLAVPLISRDEVIGVLHFRTKKPNAYSEQDLRLAERIGEQISGAIANAQLFTDLKRTEGSLRESEGRFRALVEQAAVGVAEIEMSTGRFITVNHRLCKMVGRTEEELLAATFRTITHPEDLHLHEEKTALLLAGKIGHYSLEKRYLRKDGESVWVSLTVSPLWKPREKPGRNMIVVEDITERKQVQDENERRSRQLAALHETSVELMVELDLNTLLHFITRRALDLIGGTNCHCYLYRPEADLMERVASAGQELTPEKKIRQRNEGFVGHVWATGVPLLVNDYRSWQGRKREYDALPSRALVGAPICWGEELLGVIDTMAYLPHQYTQTDLDILDMFAAQAAIAIRNARLYNKIEQVSITDELTTLFNRRGFFQLGEREFERSLRFSRPLSALMLDIDHFKRINDTYGHPAGDQVLRALADCFRRNKRGIDVDGRYGGDEFVLLLPETFLPGASQIAERLRHSVADLSIPVCRANGDTSSVNLRITVSVGVVQMLPDIPSLDALIDRADQALYRAKDSGRNRVALWEG